jgi:hypothetical protein
MILSNVFQPELCTEKRYLFQQFNEENRKNRIISTVLSKMNQMLFEYPSFVSMTMYK